MNDDDVTTAAEPPAPAAPPTRRATADRYRLGDPIGRGGMGEVIEAHDAQFGRDVAIKRMRAAAPSDAQIRRFLREARIQGQLEHPAIVPVHELGRDVDGRPFFAMKKLAGTTLSEILRSGGPDYPRQRLLRAFADVCLAVELAHTRGIVHRDLKPDNLILGDFGETYVLDWGVAKVIGDHEDIDLGDIGEHGTAAGAAIGTPGYMAPEQARGDTNIDARADVYALGCVLFEILAGERLHPRDNAIASAIAGIDGRPATRAPDREIPPELDALCDRATRVDRTERIASARELGATVQRFLDGDRDLALRRSLARSHFEAALTAYGAGDRAVAMREAGRALALDPTLVRAGELITRLMLEPPREMPPEVVRAVEREDADLSRRNAKLGAALNLGYPLFLPLFFAGGIDAFHAIAIACVGLTIAGALWHMRRPDVTFVVWPIVVLNALIIVLVGRMLSPFLLGIPLAVIVTLGLMTGKPVSRAWGFAIAALQIVAVIVPWILEQLGHLATTTVVDAGRLTLEGPLFASPAVTYAVLIVATIAVVLAALTMTRGVRGTERAARQVVHLQAWQLRHLVSEPS